MEIRNAFFSVLPPEVNFALQGSAKHIPMHISVNSVVEYPGAGLGRLITINSELNGAF